MTWAIRYQRQAEREIDALDPAVRRRILLAIDKLAQSPLAAPNVRLIQGTNQYRLRVGDYRVIDTLHDDILLVMVVRVSHRREAYR